ncbi:MAG: DUF1569 domain-containing protein [Gemmatimonadetes bacterium]|nr:DUF1569 domain-containing protein [Gemmatimonadota bacterium]
MKTLLDPEDHVEVIARLRRVSPDSPRRWGRMTAHEMICHLADAFEAMCGVRPAAATGNLFTRTIMCFVAVNFPTPWPHGIRSVPEVDSHLGGTRPAEFAADRERLEASTEAFRVRLAPGSEPMTHPFLGDMTRAEWGRWGYRHLDHHARQFGV